MLTPKYLKAIAISPFMLALALTGCSETAWAQLGGEGGKLPPVNFIDAAGVDLMSGRRAEVDGKISLGVEDHMVSISFGSNGIDANIPLSGYVFSSCVADEYSSCGRNFIEFSVNGKSEWYELDYDQLSDGSIWNWSGGASPYEVYRKDGSKLTFSLTSAHGTSPPAFAENLIQAYLSSVQMPDGETYNYEYSHNWTSDYYRWAPGSPIEPVVIKSSRGMEIRVARIASSSTPTTYSQEATIINRAHKYCGGISQPCSDTQIDWPHFEHNPTYPGSQAIFSSSNTISYGSGYQGDIIRTKSNGQPVYETKRDITDATGRVRTISTGSFSDLGGCGSTFLTRKVQDASGTWLYSYVVAPAVITIGYNNYHSSGCVAGSVTVTSPTGATYGRSGYEFTDELGRKTKYSFRPAFLPSYPVDLQDPREVTYIAYPEGKKAYLDYDSRYNLIKTTLYPKPGSALSPITWSATFPATCPLSTTRYCNKPTTVTDSKGNVTSYTYSADHGGILTEVGPAVGGIQPSKKFTYGQKHAWLKNASGTYTQAPTPIWVRTEERQCKMSALNLTTGTCAAGAADLIVTTYEYQQGSASIPSNVWLKGVAVTAEGQTLRTCYGYDPLGRKISETKPAANLASCP